MQKGMAGSGGKGEPRVDWGGINMGNKERG